uniref:Uncharacterized protein n=1 Tax=Periophthalmus magnuspinnatus TaxID=409849 RepID=A0A3B4BC28_9GOBI
NTPPHPLVSVSFQRNEQRKLKFLEGEPKALGVGLSLFYYSKRMFILQIFIAGSVAIAAKNLHLPTLRACLGMEIFSSVACLVNLIVSLLQMEPYCLNAEVCRFYDCFLSTLLLVIQVALFAISITLAVYACKVVNCCSPAPKVPVIMIQAPPAPQ